MSLYLKPRLLLSLASLRKSSVHFKNWNIEGLAHKCEILHDWKPVKVSLILERAVDYQREVVSKGASIILLIVDDGACYVLSPLVIQNIVEGSL